MWLDFFLSTSSATNVSREPRSWAERWTWSHSSSWASITISIHSLVEMEAWGWGWGPGNPQTETKLDNWLNSDPDGQTQSDQLFHASHEGNYIPGNIKDDTWFFTQVWVSNSNVGYGKKTRCIKGPLGSEILQGWARPVQGHVICAGRNQRLGMAVITCDGQCHVSMRLGHCAQLHGQMPVWIWQWRYFANMINIYNQFILSE